MLFWLTIFVLALPIRASIAPVIGLGINSDKLGTFDAIEPTLEWAGAATVGESVDLQVCFTNSIRDECGFFSKLMYP